MNRLAGNQPRAWTRPIRLRVDLNAASTTTKVVLQMARTGDESQYLTGRVADGRTAEIDLAGLPVGAYEPTLVVSAPDGSARPSLVKLGTIEVV